MGSASRVTVSLWPFSCKCNGAKNIASPVAGRADILLVPDLDSGDILAKQLEYLAGAQIAGIVLGARIRLEAYDKLRCEAREAALREGVHLVAHLLEGAEVDTLVRFLVEYKADLLVIGLQHH